MNFLCYLPFLVVLSACANASGDCAGSNSGQCSVVQHDANEPVRRGDFEPMLKAYIDDHPEIVAEMNQKLRLKQMAERQAKGQQALTESRVEVFEDAADPVLGNPHGDVTVVEFFDNECPFCKKLSPTLEQLVAKDSGVRVVLKEYPHSGAWLGNRRQIRTCLRAARKIRRVP